MSMEPHVSQFSKVVWPPYESNRPPERGRGSINITRDPAEKASVLFTCDTGNLFFRENFFLGPCFLFIGSVV